MVSPALSHVSWPRNYEGTLYTATFTPSPLALNYQWSVTPMGSSTSSTTFSSTECANQAVSQSGFSASCGLSSITLSTASPITAASSMTVTATGAEGYSFSFMVQINPFGKSGTFHYISSILPKTLFNVFHQKKSIRTTRSYRIIQNSQTRYSLIPQTHSINVLYYSFQSYGNTKDNNGDIGLLGNFGTSI